MIVSIVSLLCGVFVILAEAFDRNTGESVPVDLLKTYREALCQYHIASEAKFRNGSFHDKGETFRRCVKTEQIIQIGKESNNIECDGLGMPEICRYKIRQS